MCFYKPVSVKGRSINLLKADSNPAGPAKSCGVPGEWILGVSWLQALSKDSRSQNEKMTASMNPYLRDMSVTATSVAVKPAVLSDRRIKLRNVVTT